jgi:acetyl esterase/lipase
LGLEATSPLPNNRQPDRVKPSTAFVTAVVLAEPSPTPMIDRRTAVVAALALGKAVGAEAELVAYPGKPHGFDFSDTDPMAADAIGRVVRIFEARL